MRSEHCTPGEAAVLLGLTASGVRWLMDTRRLRGERTVGGRRLLRRTDVLRYKAKREAGRLKTLQPG
jgi:excisionase family DNA binding protein